MRIVVNHLTRMQKGYICIAGIDEKTHRHVRPVKGSRFDLTALAGQGGAFDIANVVDIGGPIPLPSPPEVEDHSIASTTPKRVGTMSGPEFWTLLDHVAKDSLAAIFGPELVADRSGASVPLHKGSASLGVLRPSQPPSIDVDGYGKIRMRVGSGSHQVDLAVNDLRLYDGDWDPDLQLVASIAEELAGGKALLSVGLGRAWHPDGDPPSRHWLQVNNVHLASDPAWKRN